MMLRPKNKGFVLIEIIIYVGLFALMMGGLLIVANQLTYSTSELGTKVISQEEINFISRKINWMLGGLSKINEPASGRSSTLEIERGGLLGETFLLRFNDVSKDIEFCSQSCHLNENFSQLNTKNVTVSSVYFEKITHPSTGTDGVKIVFKINDITSVIERYISL